MYFRVPPFGSICPLFFGSILFHQPLEIHQHPSKNRFQGASHLRSTPPSSFLRCWLHFGTSTWMYVGHLGAIWGAIGGLSKASWTVRESVFFGGLLGPFWVPFWEVFGWYSLMISQQFSNLILQDISRSYSQKRLFL